MPDRNSSTSKPDGHIHAPWTMAQVEGLNTWQASGQFHPYTCGNGHGPLIATVNGWVCLLCDYTQDWAHSFSVIYPEVRSADTISVFPQDQTDG